MDGELDKIKKFVDNQRYLIQIERDEEETQLKELLKDTSVKLLTKYGFCFVKLKVEKLKMGAFDKPLVSFRPKHFDNMKKYDEEHNTGTLDNIKFTNNARFSRGDLVALYPYEKGQAYFTGSPLATGSVEKLEDYRMTVAFSDNVDEVDFFSDEFEGGLFCVVQLVNDVTFRRYSECLDRMEYYIQHPESPNHALLRVLFDLDRPFLHHEGLLLPELRFFDGSLNEFQRLAVQRCVACEFYSLIHGPPGTGKTKTVCEVIQQMAAKHKKVLVTAASNVAVDNIIERLEQLASEFKIIRVGNPTRSLE
jgi:superfamily I DNA and/or RNA helicase